MFAMRIRGYGEAGMLRWEEAPMPDIGPQDVLVEVHAAGVNPCDYQFRRGDFQSFAPLRMPCILGWDVAGTVHKIGAAVEGFTIGEPVFAMGNMQRDGAYAQFIAVDAAHLAPKPCTLSFEQAAAVPLAALTAWRALVDVVKVSAAHHVLIHAAAGGVGSFAVQLARCFGARVTATASAERVGWVASLGAERVIDYREEDFASGLTDLDAVLDTVGGDTRARSWNTLRPGGVLVAIAMPPPDSALADGLGVRAAMVQVVPDGARLRQIGAMIDAGQLRVLIDRVWPLAQAAEAHERSESRRAHGKIVLRVR